MLTYQYDDGGRATAGHKGSSKDCVTRAIAIATGMPYQQVYDLVNLQGLQERRSKTGGNKRSTAASGVFKPTTRRIMKTLGWTWHPTMGIGTGCRVHLHGDELPMGRLVVSVSRHLVAVIDHVIRDTSDPRREVYCIDPDNGQPLKHGQWRNQNGVCSIQRRCVYGYWTKD